MDPHLTTHLHLAILKGKAAQQAAYSLVDNVQYLPAIQITTAAKTTRATLGPHDPQIGEAVVAGSLPVAALPQMDTALRCHL